jgi:hypothetical protein
MNIKILLGLVFLFLLAACRTVESAAVAPIAETAVPQPSPTAIPEPTATPVPTPNPLTPPIRRIKAGDLLLAADIDDIPAIFATPDMFVDVKVGSTEWPDDELVIALTFNGEARAYPIRLLSLHEIVNDTIGGQQVAITWCPLCFSAIAFDPMVDGRALTFGVSGYLYNDNLVMYDHQTNTLWSQLVGQGIRGAQRGTQLATLPSLITSWGEWKTQQPETTILSAEKLGQLATDIIDPYAGYYTSGAAGFSSGLEINDALPAKTLVAGVVAGKDSRAYPLTAVQNASLINDQIGQLSLLLAFEESLNAILAYNRIVDGQILTFDWADIPGNLRDAETGTLWDAQTGIALEGPLQGKQLTPVSAPLVFWFAWAAFHPDTAVYEN